MADGIDTIPRSSVIELFDAIEAVLDPFERADLRARFQEILWKHNEDQGAAKLLVDHDPYFELYDDVGTALEKMPSSRPDAQPQQQPVPPTPAPRQPRPLLAPDKTIRNANIWYSGGSGGAGGGGGGGSAMANVSQRSREDARIQMANAARAWQRIGGGSASYWNKLKTESGVAGNSTTTNKNDKKNANNDDVSGVPFDNLTLNQSSAYTSAARRPRPTSAFTPASRSTRHTPNTRDTRIFKKKPQTSRSRLPPPPSAAPPPPPPLHQNLQQLSNYIKSQAASARARAREQREQPSAQAQSQKTLYDLDNDVIMRELRKRQDQRQMQNQFGKRLRQ
ncbi:uncharacterized protein J3D65DRAFT_602830 [Phyllosticta citribraziliensis]|uniref:CUE domain-containing protein n=1 Tax=Phyllosticta citribraziliensis TaxID=989973 RepID=A0ABR1LPX6_9PEZI